MTTMRKGEQIEGAITLVLVEDHEMVANALGRVLQSHDDLELVATAGSIAAGVEAVGRFAPDVIITDLRLPDGMVTDHMAELRGGPEGPAVMILTGAPTEKAVLDALAAGVTGFLAKAQPMPDLIDGVHRVARGEVVVAPELLHVLVDRIDRGGGHASALTRREVDVLQCLADGQGTDEIAESLHLSRNTIRNHVSRILLKLGAHSRLEAVSEGARRGIISPPY